VFLRGRWHRGSFAVFCYEISVTCPSLEEIGLYDLGSNVGMAAIHSNDILPLLFRLPKLTTLKVAIGRGFSGSAARSDEFDASQIDDPRFELVDEEALVLLDQNSPLSFFWDKPQLERHWTKVKRPEPAAPPGPAAPVVGPLDRYFRSA